MAFNTPFAALKFMTFALTVALLVARGSPTLAASPACSAPVIDTTSGQICGLALKPRSGPVGAYLGIPYAQSPAGPNRWKPPVPARPSGSVYNATALGPACPQKIGSESSYPQSEDCLSLNVWAPRRGKRKRPVMVFIHGGAFVEGTSASPLYDGGNLASTGKVVVVTVNYRLGALGFLYAVEGLTGNYGFLDQQLALRWVRDNVARFGGDPDNVTLFGESAGAMSVGLHLVAPASQNLFRAAIMQSNPYALPYRHSDETQRTGKMMRRDLGCSFDQSSRSLQCMRQAPLKRVLKYQNSPGLALEGALSGFSDLLLWAPIIDGRVIAGQPVAARPTKPVMIGTNKNEGLTFAALFEDGKRTITKWEYNTALGILFSHKTAKAIRERPDYRPHGGDNADVFARLTTDYLFTCAGRHVLSRARASSFGYHFTKRTSYDVWPGLALCAPAGETAKACHGFELPFVFGNPVTLSARRAHRTHGFAPGETKLSKSMIAYWSSFAARHDPNHARQPKWPAFTRQRPHRQVLDTPISTKQDLGVDCGFWDKIGYGETGLFDRL